MSQPKPPRPERKFDPARAGQLDAPEREAYLPDAGVDRVLAVNLLHEIRGEGALEEMRRLARTRRPPSSNVPVSGSSAMRASAGTSC